MYFATRLARQGYNPLLVGRKKSSLLSNACMKKTLRVTAAPGVDLYVLLRSASFDVCVMINL